MTPLPSLKGGVSQRPEINTPLGGPSPGGPAPPLRVFPALPAGLGEAEFKRLRARGLLVSARRGADGRVARKEWTK